MHLPAPLRLTPLALCLLLLLHGCGGGQPSGSDVTPTGIEVSSPTGGTLANPLQTADAAAPSVSLDGSSELQASLTEEAAATTLLKSAQAAIDSESQRLTAESGTATTFAAMTTSGAGAIDAPTMHAMAGSSIPSLTVKARADIAGGTGALMTVVVDGVALGTVEVRSTTWADYRFQAPTLKSGSRVDVVFGNNAVVSGQNRNLYVGSLSDGLQWVTPAPASSVIDRGLGAKAFDGVDTVPGGPGLYWNAALRVVWPAAPTADANLTRRQDAHRFLQQASFGASPADLDGLVVKSYPQWIAEQQALPYTADFVADIQARYDRGDAWRPGGANYSPTWVAQKFWERAAQAPDQLRQRVAFALHQILMVSQADSNLWMQARAYAGYTDLLHRHAFGNYRNLLEQVALSPAMGIYLSHMRNRKEDPTTGRLPDENFAREVMQLFTIGLYELNIDGTLKRDAAGLPIETYGTADVMAMAKVFTGFSWALPDAQLSESSFLYRTPSTKAADDARIDLLPMRAYPGQHSTAAKTLFAGKPWAITLPTGQSANADVSAALDALFRHPNTPPFVSRQLIQHLVTSNPSPDYVRRVATVFADNGAGVRGDLAAVVRAILLDPEARTATATSTKLREPILRVTQWMRALGVRSATGQYVMAWELDTSSQRALAAPSVFGYFRPGYVPPGTVFATTGTTLPEFQITFESSVASWINTAENMVGWGLGSNGAAADVTVDESVWLPLAAQPDAARLVDRLNLVMLGGRMSTTLRQQLLATLAGIGLDTTLGARNRFRAVQFLILASPEYATQS